MMETYRRSDEINELFAALAKAQGVFESAEKARENPHFKSRYATLESVVDATRKGREANGLAILQMPTNSDGNMIALTTLLGHSSGQWIESVLSVTPARFDAQGVGSVISYLRRYALMSILGIAPEDDDDGNAAVAAPRAVAPQQRPPAPLPPSPPHDPATGEIGPYRVPLVDGQTLAWGQRLISHIKTAETLIELATWNNLNREALDASKDTKAGASVLRAFDAKRADLDRIAALSDVVTEADAERILQ